ncbi:MAG: hypothetical protein AB8W37_03695 [Arsenophonus endosymbiont of Dermacentor nuttalli]
MVQAIGYRAGKDDVIVDDNLIGKEIKFSNINFSLNIHRIISGERIFSIVI